MFDVFLNLAASSLGGAEMLTVLPDLEIFLLDRQMLLVALRREQHARKSATS